MKTLKSLLTVRGARHSRDAFSFPTGGLDGCDVLGSNFAVQSLQRIESTPPIGALANEGPSSAPIGWNTGTPIHLIARHGIGALELSPRACAGRNGDAQCLPASVASRVTRAPEP
jgi:hypothetical protein